MMKNLSVTGIQRTHGLFLIVLSLTFAVATVYMEKTGVGPYGFLHENPMGEAGLLQAYLLMSVIGLTIVLGASHSHPSKQWNIIGILAHCPPLIALMLYGFLFFELDLVYLIGVSIAIHATWITVELLTLKFLPLQPES